jgi:hypothetical protein
MAEKINERIQRAVAQRIFIMSASHDDSYQVMGTRGDLYRVHINCSNWVASRCSCPDFSKRHQLCKHVFYVLIRVKHMKKSELIQGCLSTDHHHVVKEQEIDPSHVGETCAICYDEFGTKEKVTLCDECTKPFHVQCINMWKKHCLKKRLEVTCPLCRQRLVV